MNVKQRITEGFEVICLKVSLSFELNRKALHDPFNQAKKQQLIFLEGYFSRFSSYFLNSSILIKFIKNFL